MRAFVDALHHHHNISIKDIRIVSKQLKDRGVLLDVAGDAQSKWDTAISDAVKHAYPRRNMLPCKELKSALALEYEAHYILSELDREAYYSDTKDRSRAAAVRNLQASVKNRLQHWVARRLELLLDNCYGKKEEEVCTTSFSFFLGNASSVDSSLCTLSHRAVVK